MVEPSKISDILGRAIQLYADQDGLSEAEGRQITEGGNEAFAKKVIRYLGDGIVTPDEIGELVRGVGVDKKSLSELVGNDGTKPLMQRLKFFKDHESNDLKKLSDRHPDEIWLQTAVVLENGMNLSFLPESARDNEIVVSSAVYNNPSALIYASSRLRHNQDIAVAALSKKLDLFLYLGNNSKEDVQANSNILGRIIEGAQQLTPDIAKYIKGDRRSALIAIAKDPSLMAHLTDLHNDRQFIFEAAHIDINILSHVPKEVLGDPALAIRLLKFSESAFRHLPDRLKEDPEFVLSALAAGANTSLLNHVSPKLANNPAFAMRAVRANAQAFINLPKSMQSNRDILLEAISKDGPLIHWAPKMFSGDRDLAILAVQSWGGTLEFFDSSIRSDPHIIGLAIENDGNAIRYAEEKFRDNREFALNAVLQFGYALHYLSPRLQKDPGIIQAALQSYPLSIRDVDQTTYDLLIKDGSIQKLIFEYDIKLIRNPNDLSATLRARYDHIMTKVNEYDIPIEKLRTEHIEEVIHNCDYPNEKDTRPLAIIFDPASDHNGAFQAAFPFELFKSHRVVYHKIETDDQMVKRFHAATKFRKAGLLVVSGHGTPQALTLGNSGGWDENHLDAYDASKLAALERGLADNAQVVFASCSLFNLVVSDSFGRMASRLLPGKNLFGFYQDEPILTFPFTFGAGRNEPASNSGKHVVKCVNGHCEIKD